MGDRGNITPADQTQVDQLARDRAAILRGSIIGATAELSKTKRKPFYGVFFTWPDGRQSLVSVRTLDNALDYPNLGAEKQVFMFDKGRVKDMPAYREEIP